MNWTYSLERIQSANMDNKHFVQVTSKSRTPGEDIQIGFFTNVDTHAVKVTKQQKI